MSAVPVIAAGTFYPKSLFVGSVQGVWYDPSDLTTMFEDSAGTTAVHTPGNGTADSPVGKILDKSGNGNHATQATSTSRPTLSARYNQLTGTSTLTTQSVTTVATTYTLAFSGSGSITLSGTKTGTYTSGTSTLTSVTAGTLTLTVSGTVTNADLRVSNDGVGLPAYQNVTNANTYDSDGFPYYLKSDGVDDTLVTSAIDFTGTAVMSYFLGVRKLADPTEDAIVAFGTSSSANGFEIAGSSYWSLPKGFGIQGLGPGYTSGYVNNITAPTSKVCYASMLRGQSTWTATYSMRLNGVAQTLTASGVALPTGNFANSALYLYRRSSSATLWFNGRTYGIIIRGASSTSTEISNAETWMNTKAKIY